jgi:hypothetical protein
MGFFKPTAFAMGLAKGGLDLFDKAEKAGEEGLENLKAAKDEVNEEIASMKDNYNKAIQIGDNVGGGAFAKYLFDREDISYLAGLANQTQETRADEMSMLKKNFELLPPEAKAKYEDGEFGDVVKEKYDSEVDSLKIKKGLVSTNNMGEATANTLAGKVQTMVDRSFEPRRQNIIDTVSTGGLKESKPIEGSYESIQTSASEIPYLDMDLETQRPFTTAFQSYMKDEFLDPILNKTKDESAIDNQIKTAIKTALPTAFDLVQPDGTVIQDGKSVNEVLLQLRGDSQITLDTIREEILMEDYFNQRYRGGYGDGYLSNLKEGYSQLDPSTILQVFASYDVPYEEKVRLAVQEGFMDEEAVRKGFQELGIQ